MEACMATSCSAALSTTPASLFTQLTQLLLVSQCALNTVNYPPDRTTDILSSNREFDFVIVGAGTAGSVLARRLTEVNDWNVLLIEAGKDPSIFTEVPGFMTLIPDSDEDYAYQVEPQEGVCQGQRGKRCRWRKGKALGGSSVMNAMLHVFGNDRDYNNWEAMGNEGWGYEKMLHYLRKAVNCPAGSTPASENRHCGDGPMSVRSYNYSETMYQDVLLEAAQELGLDVLEPLIGDRFIGFGRALGTQSEARRVNAAKAFLSPVKDKKNLYVMKSSRADKILMDGNRATGVRVTLEDGRSVDVKATKEVILSAGSVASPQLLMLSGIGPEKHLQDMGIPVIADLPVGRNLQDHVMWPGLIIGYQNDTQPPSMPIFMMDLAYTYLMHGKGDLASVPLDLQGFVNVNDPASKYPDIQFIFGFFPQWQSAKIGSVYKMQNMDDGVLAGVNRIIMENNAIMAVSILLNPKSRGVVELRSADPADPVKIHANYFEEEEDFQTLLKSVDVIRSLTNAKASRKHGMDLKHLDLPGCKREKLDSKEYWACNIRQTATSVFHAVGTAKMGPKSDPAAVVDPRLRVHGVQRLRVVDGSIMPTIVSGNTNSPIMTIAEKAADMIKEDWSKDVHSEL
nr:glucose dehydrogenase [FAD, quinone]-like [Nomia melanderi]XP_031838207.1 glucose dehydrogenase [FAD, quinone]-like [Nomia melanderi]XP_031838208.1 glucose dehydrogenase [FAD, quinone]-like [Nomia melanderi]XP_031838209.1 glucose dehydrogenase [FAD, quinone]-like [Nomia melanderi]XP_031838210.1 glucose dehydrogenase [FAD, quinone]-like [Nomia melanderi]